MNETNEQNNEPAETAIVKQQVLLGSRGLILRDYDDMWRFANCVIRADMTTGGVTQPSQVLLMVQAAAERGHGPMWALQNLTCINKKVGMMGDGALGDVRNSGLCEYYKEWIEGEGDNMVAHAESKRKDDAHPKHTTFSVEDAKTAKLWGKTGRSGQPTPWITHPKRMLTYRARGFNLRDNFPDVLQGMHLAEEFIGEVMAEPERSEAAESVPPREERETPADEDVSDESVQARFTAKVRALVNEAMPWLNGEVGDVATDILPNIAFRATGDADTDWRTPAPWTAEVCEKCLADLEAKGLDLGWLPAAEQPQEAQHEPA